MLIVALAGGATIGEAASRAGVSERTAARRLAEPEFRQEVTDARAAMVQQALGVLAQASWAAAATLRSLLQPSNPPSVRLGASKAILEIGRQLREGDELVARIEALEQQIADQKQPVARRWAS